VGNPGSFDTDTRPGAAVLRLRGDHDLSTASLLRQLLLEMPHEQAVVVIDFTECTFLDSTILGVLVSAHRRLHADGRRLEGTGADGVVRNALRLTGIEPLLFSAHRGVPDTGSQAS
jgi:anti-anti-sigma factor